MNKKINNFINLEGEFFDLDKDNKVANMKLEFNSPNEVFDRIQ